ncbi:centrosomal protein of 97 kDa isoform X2 [Conger conger]|uniref:centrosomal protein of 97 kDa isoform X2 n=1 Tax=Conger conger TaxID=82655 RepID=UPI002A5AAFAA|nr:centrosomal protein of 97 kDa isoform X2 [Conger conger]
MGVPSLTLDTNGPMVDLSDQGLQKLEPNFPCPADTHTLILDRNHIMKLEHLERSHRLQQLSVGSNRLVRMMGVSQLTSLKVLNLPSNSIGCIEGLKELVHLEWLNLAGNNIKVMEQLNTCVALQHLDLSDNNISQIGDLTKLSALKTLLLHGNIITTLRAVPAFLPPHLSILSLAENEIRDLNEASYLAPLLDLEQLSIMSNPCVMATPSLPGCDYRPYMVSWCLSLKVLDGYVVSQKEGLKAEWLYSQGKGRMYRPGQHVQLVQYLASVCPLTSSSALQSAEDAKLEKILNKQRLHQRQLLQQTRPAPPRPTQLDVEQHRPEAPALVKHTGTTPPKNSTQVKHTGTTPPKNSTLVKHTGTTPPKNSPLHTGTTPPKNSPLHTGTTPPKNSTLHTGNTPPKNSTLHTGTTPPKNSPLHTGTTPPKNSPLHTGTTPPKNSPLHTGTTPPKNSPLVKHTGTTPPKNSTLHTGTTPPKNSTLHTGTTPPKNSTLVKHTGTTPPKNSTLVKHTDPAVQVNSWLGSEHSYAAPLTARTPTSAGEPLLLEDVQPDEGGLRGSLLSSESTFLLYPPSPHAAQSDSEEEETYEPDSLAPDAPRAAPGAGPDPETDRSLTEGHSLRADEELALGACGEGAAAGAEPRQEQEAGGRGDGSAAAVRIQAWWRGLFTRRFHPQAREVRSEIRLRRMQEHILFLSGEVERMQKEQEEERLQRLVQEEAVRFLWTQLQSVLDWQRSVQDPQQGAARAEPNGRGPAPQCPLQATASALTQACSEVSFPDSGFQSTGEPQGALEDSLCSGTGESLETVRAGAGRGGDSQDGSLLQQYLSSVQQLEEAEEGASEQAATPPARSPVPGLSARDSPSPSSVNWNEETERQNTLLEAGM